MLPRFIAGAGLGAGLMYALDPRQGRRRRALARDKVRSLLARTDDALDVTARDMANRARGVLAEARTLVSGERGDVPGPRLAARVRSEIGRYCSHPGAIEVSVADGRVTLRGPVLESEVDGVVRAVTAIRGVSGVENQLEPHAGPDGVPGLQGGVPRLGPRPDVMQSRWSPTTRVLVGGTAVALALRVLWGARAATGLVGVVLPFAARAVLRNAGPRLLGRSAGDRQRDDAQATPSGPPAEAERALL
ncbi:MAG TPA: BON domain-containing protein [Candidatus Binatia bacterium]|nr:BON domain-containing protein [Candidatus Binatia bacterium]